MAPYADPVDGRKVYVGNLEEKVEQHDLQRLFDEYGAILNIWIARKPPGFAFVTFEDPRDARDAVSKVDGVKFQGKRLRVEVAKGPRRPAGYTRGIPRARSRSEDRYFKRPHHSGEYESSPRRAYSRSNSVERYERVDRDPERYLRESHHNHRAPFSPAAEYDECR